MSKVFFSVGMTLDGYIAPEGMDMEHIDDPEYEDWMARWMELQKWVFEQKFFRESLELGEGGETGRDNRTMEETFERTGVSIMGKRMFDGIDRDAMALEIEEAVDSPLVTHLRYTVTNR